MGAKPKKEQSSGGIDSLCKPAGFKRKGGSKKQIKSEASIVEDTMIMNMDIFKEKLKGYFEQIKNQLIEMDESSLTYSSKEKISVE